MAETPGKILTTRDRWSVPLKYVSHTLQTEAFTVKEYKHTHINTTHTDSWSYSISPKVSCLCCWFTGLNEIEYPCNILHGRNYKLRRQKGPGLLFFWNISLTGTKFNVSTGNILICFHVIINDSTISSSLQFQKNGGM